jgi:hypothetical protein
LCKVFAKKILPLANKISESNCEGWGKYPDQRLEIFFAKQSLTLTTAERQP